MTNENIENNKNGEGNDSPYLILVALCLTLYTIKQTFFKIYWFIIYFWLCWVFVSVRGLAFSSYGKRGSLFIAVRGPLTIAASLVAEHRLQTRRLSNCCSRAQLLRGMWDPPRPGLEPVSPALAGRFSTTAPPGKPQQIFINELNNRKTLPLPLKEETEFR